MKRNRFIRSGGAAMVAFAALHSGCGGTTASATETAEEHLFLATMPDGSHMGVLLEPVHGGYERGLFFETAGEANDGGCGGALSGNHLELTCDGEGEKLFTLRGDRQANGHIRAERSDMPGVALDFAPVDLSPHTETRDSFTVRIAFEEPGSGEPLLVKLWGAPVGADGHRFYQGFSPRGGVWLWDKGSKMDLFMGFGEKTQVILAFPGPFDPSNVKTTKALLARLDYAMTGPSQTQTFLNADSITLGP